MNAGEFREVGHRVVDLLAEYLEKIEERPVFPDAQPAALTKPLRRGTASGSQFCGVGSG